MSKTKPQQRLVSKGRYVYLQGKKVAWLTLGCVLLIPILLLIRGILREIFRDVLWTGWGYWMTQGNQPDFVVPGTPELCESFLFDLIFCAVVCFILFQATKTSFSKAESVALMAPITDRNVYLLPLQETLVRGADLPPTRQQTELLRAASAGQETPAQELLRANTGET